MASSDKEKQTTDCPVYHEKYSDPKILPCAHLLCRDCLVNWMKTKTEALCPLCRSDIVDPKHSSFKNPDDFVDSLPTDHTMSVMVESLKIFSEKHVCHVHNNVHAKSLCLHCFVKLCQGCIEVHRKLPSSNFHKVEDLATLTPELLAQSRQATCSVHPDENAKLICMDHKVIICQLCAITKHRACSEVTYVSKVSGKYKQSLLEMENKLNTEESILSQAITELEEHLLKADKSTNAALAEIDSTFDSILKSVETCRKRLKKLVTEEHDKMKAAVHKRKYIISHKHISVTSHQGLIKRALQIANDNSLVAMVTNLEHRVNDLDTCLPQDTHSCLTVTLEIDRGSISLVENEVNKMIKPIFSFATGTEMEMPAFFEATGREIEKCNVATDRENVDWIKLIATSPTFFSSTLSDLECPSGTPWPHFALRGRRHWGRMFGVKNVASGLRSRSSVFPQRNTWMFHNNCGSNIVLSSNGQTAEVKDANDFQNRVLISRVPIYNNKLYEILIEETDTQYSAKDIAIGVCEENPSSVILPTVCFRMTTCVGVHALGGTHHGQWTNEYSCPALWDVKAGSRLGVMVDTSHSLHVYVDGKNQGVMAKNLVEQCYVMFDLYPFLKVSTLPGSAIQ